jgi:hypothetical protein
LVESFIIIDLYGSWWKMYLLVFTALASLLEDIYGCLLEGLTEYTMDSRGDIGAWVREAAMTGLQVSASIPV